MPVIVKEVTDQQAIAMSLIENIQREDLNVVEEAKALIRLQNEFQLTQQEEYVLNRRCLGRWKAKSEADLRNQIEDFSGYPIESITYKVNR